MFVPVRDFCAWSFGEEGAHRAYAPDESVRAGAKRASRKGANTFFGVAAAQSLRPAVGRGEMSLR